MTARILVVDDVDANLKLMQARLMAEYFEVITASNGPDALEICAQGVCDVVLLDVMMPGMDGYEVCRRLKGNAETAHIPVIMVTSLNQTRDKVAGLMAGADDFLTKPVNDLALITRVRNLARLKVVTDELRLRAGTNSALELRGDEQLDHMDPLEGRKGDILLVADDSRDVSGKLRRILESEHNVSAVYNPQEALFRAAETDFDLVVLSLDLQEFDPLRLCSQLRSLERTRMLPILMVSHEGNDAKLIRAIDIGVNDYIITPLEANELVARVRTQVRRKRLNDRLRNIVQNTLELAVRDSLTGLNNRRYFDSHMRSLFNKAQVTNKPLALIAVDIDHFKQVNDTYGHPVGDKILQLFAEQLVKNVRTNDLASRYGGEEFVIAMPDTDFELAVVVAERMRREIAAKPMVVDNGALQISVTLSAGVSVLEGPDDTVDAMLKRADDALYAAKKAGRNCVSGQAA